MLNGAEKWQRALQPWNESVLPMFKMRKDPRFTPIGRILSLTGLDETPQLFNIIRGEMSFVGPRPLPVQENKLLDSTWKYRQSTLPGIFSEWAISDQKHSTTEAWQNLEKKTLKEINSPAKDLLLMFRYCWYLSKAVFRKTKLM